MKNRESGFTIVELLIVIVVIAILALIVITGFNGMQARAKDAERETDTREIAQRLEMYYIDHGHYPRFSLPGNIGIASGPWRAVNMPDLPDVALTPPGASGVSLVNNTNPTHSQYGYHNAGSCGSAPQCAHYRLYWRSNLDNSIKVIESKH